MDLFPRSVDFDKVWKRLHNATSEFLRGQGQPSIAVCKDRFSDVYSLCIAEPKPFAERLYQQLQLLFTQHVSDICQQVLSCGQENFLTEYNRHWQAYSAGMPHLSQLYWYLNTNVVKKQKLCQVNIDYSLYGISCIDNMVDVGELALRCWQETMVHKCRDLFVDSLLNEVSRDRSGLVIDEHQQIVQAVIQSFVDLLQFKAKNKLQLYEDLFEIPFFNASNKFCQQESKRLRDTCDVPTFVAKMSKLLNDEVALGQRYLRVTSHPQVTVQCQKTLLSDDNVNFINSGCRQLVSNEQWTDLALTYQLLEQVENKLDGLLAEFEHHLKDTGLSRVCALPTTGPNVAKLFVETVVQFRACYREHIAHTFNKSAKFLSALDKACMAVMKYKVNTKTISLVPELLSKYCDELLQKGIKGQSETDVQDQLQHAIALLDYIEDKDVFERFYARALARRLIFGQSQSMELEEMVVSRLKEKCGSEYTNKLNHMFTDIAISADLNTKFNNFLETKVVKQHVFNISVLQAGAWPVSQTSLSAMYLPQGLDKTFQLFEEFYRGQFSGRKLSWLHNLSRVELRFGFCKDRLYLVTVNMAMAAVLCLFNDAESLTCGELQQSTHLSCEELLKHLQVLVDNKVLNTKASLCPESVLQLNLEFNNKRTKFQIFSASLAEANQGTVETDAAIERDRQMFIQSVIVRIMKTHKQLQHIKLIEEVIESTKARFTPHISTIKKCINILLDRQYIERAENSLDNYVYVA
jgi:cullin 2